MPRVRPLGNQREANFGAVLKSAMVRNRMTPVDIAKKIGRTDRTVNNRFNKPGDMTLTELRLYIKATGLSKEDVIDYLYET